MKTIKLLALTGITVFSLSSCNNDDDTPELLAVESEQVSNLFAPQTGGQGTGMDVSGDFAKFDFSTGDTTTSDTDWDIAFRGTTIAVNGGVATGTADEPARNGNAAVYIAENTFAGVSEVDTSLFEQDSAAGFAIPTGSDNGWYTYNFMANLITPITGKVLVFRTRDDRYAKVEILSYYQNADSSNPANSRYYTFNYVYQPNENVTTFE